MPIKAHDQVPETGQTSPKTSRLMLVVFVVIITMPMLLQVFFERSGKVVSGDHHIQAFDLFRVSKDTPLPKHIASFERELEDRSVVSEAVRPWIQCLELRFAGRGNQKVIPAQVEDWLFYRPGLRSITGASFEPQFSLRPNQKKPLNSELLPTIVHFHQLLKANDIELVIAPVPNKPSIYPEKLVSTFDESLGPPQNVYLESFYEELRAKGVNVLDLTDEFWQHRHERDLFLRLDTHWSPDGMSLFARKLAERLRSQFPWISDGSQKYEVEKTSVTNHGDIFDLLSLPKSFVPYEAQEVLIERVNDGAGEPVTSDPDSPIVLLGDSCTNIFSQHSLNWGTHAGLGEQLTRHLKQPIHWFAVNGGGPADTRKQLAAHGLEGKKLVVWQIMVRDFVDPASNWRKVDLPRHQPVPDFLEVKAKIVKLSRPLESDEDFVYPDTTTTTLYKIFREIGSEGPEYTEQQLAAVEFSQLNRDSTGTEDFRVGDVHQLRLIPFQNAGPKARSCRSNDDIGLDHLPRFWVADRKGKKKEAFPEAPIIMVGNSLQRLGIDFPQLSSELGQRVASVESGGQTSAYKLAIVSRYCKSTNKPKCIILSTMRDCLTFPAYNGLGTEWEKPALEAIGDDAELKALMERLSVPCNGRYENFHENVGKSFLPHIIELTKEAGVQLIVLRSKTIEYAEGSEKVHSDKYVKYLNALEAYLENEGVAYFDYAKYPELTLDLYGKGSHFNERGRALWTQLVVEDLRKVMDK